MQHINPVFRRNLKKRFLLGLLMSGICFILTICTGCSKGGGEEAIAPAADSHESFTFYNIGAGAVYSETLRDNMGNRLGPDSVARITILDLTLHHKPVVETHFQELYQLHQQLNYPAGERVEHDITKLMYRYAKKTDVPFEYVELVFSNANQRPIIFKISAKAEGERFVSTLKQKYGPPETIEWKTRPGKTLNWKKNGDLFLVSISKNRHGQLEYHFTIYFMKNLNSLADAERQTREQRAAEQKKAGERAF